MVCDLHADQSLNLTSYRISALANVDPRIVETLRAIRDNKWSYHTGAPSKSHLLQDYAQELGFPISHGDPLVLPSYGGSFADSVWKDLGVNNRRGVGGLPCQIVHAGVGGQMGLIDSCMANSVARLLKAFLEAVTIYLPVKV
jgi:hypothetical protein